jgi:hypothetical protein
MWRVAPVLWLFASQKSLLQVSGYSEIYVTSERLSKCGEGAVVFYQEKPAGSQFKAGQTIDVKLDIRSEELPVTSGPLNFPNHLQGEAFTSVWPSVCCESRLLIEADNRGGTYAVHSKTPCAGRRSPVWRTLSR